MSKQIIEINGVKLEVDLSTAKRIEEYRIGDTVKVLKKEYSDNFRSYAGTIVGFDDFKERPTIIIAYLESDYRSADVKFLYFNSETKDVEICMACENDLVFCKESVIDTMNRSIAEKKAEIASIETKRDFFIHNFSKCFEKEII